MENKNEFLGYFDGNANLSEILAAIESLPDTTKNFMADLFSNAPLSIFQAMRLEEYKKGEVFIRETAPADKVYFLIRGRVQAVENRVLGISYNFTHYNAFESFGTMEILLDYDAYRATLVADTDCQFLVLTREDYARWTETDSHALKLISKETCEYLLEEARKDRLLRFLSGKDSLMMLFMKEYEEMMDDNDICRFTLTRQQLSEFSGLSLRTVNRAIQTIEEEGYVQHSRGHFQINAEQYNRIKKYINSFIADEGFGGTEV